MKRSMARELVFKSILRWGIGPHTRSINTQECGTKVDKKAVFFCRLKKDKFKGKILCCECQEIPEI